MFGDPTNQGLSVQEAAAWLRHVVTQELLQVRAARFESALESTGDEGKYQNYYFAVARAWKAMARYGVSVEMTSAMEERLISEGLTSTDIALLRLALEQSEQQIHSEISSPALREEFEKGVGKRLGSGRTRFSHAVKILLDGRAAAWAQLEEDGGMDAALTLATELVGQNRTEPALASISSTRTDHPAETSFSAVALSPSPSQTPSEPTPAPNMPNVLPFPVVNRPGFTGG